MKIPEQRKHLDRDHSLGLSKDVVDRAFWLDDGYGQIEGQEWIEAIEAIDVKRDKSKLIGLLRSDSPLSRSARHYLADMLERYQLKRPRGKQRTPAYDRSDAEAMLLLAKEAYREERHQGRSPKEALATAAKRYHLVPDVLKAAVEGRRGSSRRARKRNGPAL
jgi:hypothetical protein